MKNRPLLLILAGSIIFLASCYKSETVYYDQLDVTLTQYDDKFDFSTYSTFYIPDSVILKTNYLKESEIEDFYAPGGTSEKTLALVKQKLLDRGYQEESDSNAADFVLAPTILLVEQRGATYYPPGWWWGYPGWGWGGWGPGWGYPGYPWNPGYVQYYSYKQGNIVLEMIDGGSFSQLTSWLQARDNDPPDMLIRWMATIEGYVSSTAEYNEERAKRGIDEAFEQSPYISK
jgi:hypothetical protein